ncbi:MAG: hypothetical protein JXR76_17170 [Deltaproteobacteria bacterium]|nr:hypothetical protein [Deltaproteobacteria bacterium]
MYMRIGWLGAVLLFCVGCNRTSGHQKSPDSDTVTTFKTAVRVIEGDSEDERAMSVAKREDSVTPKQVMGEQLRVQQERILIEDWLRSAKLRRIKPVSSRSKSLRLIFSDGSSAIFKPLLKGDSSARLEVAFYRVAALLGVRHVPVSVMRPLYPDRFEGVLKLQGEEAAKAFLDAVATDDRGRVWGAMIEWMNGLSPLGAEDGQGRLDVNKIFTNKEFRDVWGPLSDAILLDYLLGNWDRFSGGNLFQISGTSELALIDHNEAFYRLNERQQQKLDEALLAICCPTPELIVRIRALTREDLISAVKTTGWPGELLRPVEIGNILLRKDSLLDVIDSRLAAEARGGKSGKKVKPVAFQ